MIEAADGVQAILDNARAHGVGHMLCVCINLEGFPAVLDLAKSHGRLSASVGVHPNTTGVAEPGVGELAAMADDEDVIAIGESGLDYFRSEGDLDWQRDRFRRHIRAARETGKPLIVHCRDAGEDVIAILREEGAEKAGGVMHCFVEDLETARRAMDLNFLISFSGIVTFRNAAAVQDVARHIPDEFLLVETDSPYLAPIPHRGRQNQPAYVRHVAECLADLRETSLEHIAAVTTANFERVFKKKVDRLT